MKYAAGGVTVKTGEPTKVEIPSGRLRLSAWVNDPYSALGSTGSAQTGWGFFADPSIIQGWAGHLDDVSPVATAMWDSKTKGVTWSNPGCLPGAPEEKRISICREAVEKCHAAGIQMLAGYEYVTGISASQSSASLFASWLKGADDTTLEEHGKQIVDFLWTKIGADWDGVGFDIELGSLDASHAERFTRFYGLLADRLAGLGNKILAIATGISATVSGGEVVISEPHTPGCARAQPFHVALGHPNIIIRPMAYDGGQQWHSRLRQWHEKIIEYALRTVGLPPGQFQLGVKIMANKSGDSYCCLTNPSDVATWCKELLRPHDVGLVTFAGKGHAQTWNPALNPGEPPPGQAGEPLQVPLIKQLA